MPNELDRVLALFVSLAKLDPAERAAALERECGQDAALRREVEAMLRAHFPLSESDRGEPDRVRVEPEATLDSSESPEANPLPTLEFVSSGNVQSSATSWLTAAHSPGDSSGGAMIAKRYILEHKIGEGGMGEVWIAQQVEPVKRKVAIKLIKTGMDSKAVLARFEQERQALALMDHPHIARVLDGGMTPTGQPFFAMELVQGQTLNRFCDQTRLTLRERLELFVPICQAVQHAHQKGIIHRDLKPANILVTVIDGKPVPKVIDFGVAKATAGKLTDESLATHFGAVVGTLEYMAPEQAGHSGEDIDTRADIYSLGVILYELLTGVRPIDSRRLQRAALSEMVRVIKEDEPSKPSTRLSSEASLPSVAALRQLDPKKLMAMLRGELDCVVMKCLEKERDRRYETASSLARDIACYLADEPVEARPPTATYRLGKFMRRNRGPVLAAGLVLLALTCGVIGTTLGLLRAMSQTALAVKEAKAKSMALQREEEQRKIAVANERTATSRAQQLEAATESLVEVFRNLDPFSEEKEGLPLREILARNLTSTADALQGTQLGEPLAVARMQSFLGVALAGVGDSKAAIAVLERSRATYQQKLGEDDDATLSVANELALAYRANGESSRAIALLLDIWERSKTTRGPNHIETLGIMNNLAAAYRSVGELTAGLPIYLETATKTRETLGPQHQAALAAALDLALAYEDLGQLDQALPLFVSTLADARTALGSDSLFALNCMNNLGGAYQKAGRVDLAEPLLLEALAGRRAKLGPNHPDTLQSMVNLALTYMDAQQPKKAIPLLEESAAGRLARNGADHPRTLGAQQMLAQAYLINNQSDKALPLMVELLAKSEALQGADHPETLGMMNNLASTYWAVQQFDKSVPLFERLLPLHVAKFGPDHPLTVNVQANLGVNYRDSGQTEQGIAALEDAVRRLDRMPTVNGARLAWVRIALAIAYEQEGKFDLAEARYRKTWQVEIERYGEGHANSATAAVAVAGSLLKQLKYEEAETILTTALATLERESPEAWSTYHARSRLGAALLGLGKQAQAEPLLLAGHTGLNERKAMLPPHVAGALAESIQSLVDLYKATNKPEEAARWQQLLEAESAQ